MFSSGPNYTKLKTNLRLAINRLKLLEKKKTELAQKARKEIADYITTGKVERAKIRVEHIIREDYLVEAMEVTEMYCDLLLARFGLIQQMKDLDEGLAEAISSIIWAAPRLQTDVAELKLIADQLGLKYGKPYAQACREQQVATISEKLVHKLGVQAPPKILVEKYLVEIAHNYNLEYEPDPQVMRESEWGNDALITLDDNTNDLGGEGGAAGGGGGGSKMNIAPAGFVGYPPQPQPAAQPFSYPAPKGGTDILMNLPNVPGQPQYPPVSAAFNIPPSGPPPPDPSADTLPPKKIDNNMQNFMPTTPASQWDDMLNMDNTPPPPYTSLPPTGHLGGMGPMGPMGPAPPSAPNSSLPPGARPAFPPDVNNPTSNQPPVDSDFPKPAPRSKFNEGPGDFQLPDLPAVPGLPVLPSVPGGSATAENKDETQDEIDFDDLTKRFEELKKKK